MPSRRHTYLIHGFNVRDEGKDTVVTLKPYISKYSAVRNWKYGWFGLLSVLARNKEVATNLAANVKGNGFPSKNRYAIGHSNGCAILMEAARQGAAFDRVLLINPALRTDIVFPANIREIIVIYTKHDRPTRAARFFEKIPFIGLLIPNAWGAMGAEGYTGDDPRVYNRDLSFALKGHSDIFTKKNLELYATLLARDLYDT